MSISADQIIEIHETLTDWFSEEDDPISPPGVRDLGLVQSAAGRPLQTTNGKDAYKSPFDKAAALFHSIVNNHAFHNGNKRTGLVSTQYLLHQFGYWLEEPTDEEMYEFTRQVAAHEICDHRVDEVATIAGWLKQGSRKALRGEFPMKFQALKEALNRFGFEIDPPDGGLLNVYKEGNIVERINKQGIKGFRPYHTDYISGLRKRLGLTPDNGVDSIMFYGHKGASEIASEFIEIRIEVIRRLART